VKPWAKRIQLFLGKKRKLIFHFWSKRGRGQKEEGHFWAKRVPPRSMHPLQLSVTLSHRGLTLIRWRTAVSKIRSERQTLGYGCRSFGHARPLSTQISCSTEREIGTACTSKIQSRRPIAYSNMGLKGLEFIKITIYLKNIIILHLFFLFSYFSMKFINNNFSVESAGGWSHHAPFVFRRTYTRSIAAKHSIVTGNALSWISLHSTGALYADEP
jgi:hypothetical protein